MALTKISGNVVQPSNFSLSGVVTATSFTGNLTGNVSSSGANTLGSLTVTNDATVGGALTVTGDLTVNGTTTTIDTAVTAVDSLAIDGSVGIGTDNPGAYFSDANDIVLQKTDDCGITIASGTSQKGTVAFADGTTGDQAYRGYIQYNHSTDSLQVATTGTEALRITSTGNIGIGTDTPIGKLHLNYNGNNGISFRMENFEGYSSFHNDGGALYIDSGQHIFRNEDGSSETLRISSTGNLGIGENNPAAKLDVKGSLSNTVDIRLRNTESNAQMSLYAFGGSAAIGSHFNNRIAMMSWSSTEGIDIITNGTGNNDFRVYTAGYGTNSERFRITSGGNVGIGLTNPGQKLTVKGTTSLMATNSTNQWMAYTYTDNTFRLNYNGAGADEVVVTTDGKMGIGVDTPTSKLQVNGSFSAENIHHCAFLMEASEDSASLWDDSRVSYSESEEAIKVYNTSGYMSKTYYFGYSIDGSVYDKWEIYAKNVLGRIYITLYYSDGTNGGSWMINGWNPTDYSRYVLNVPSSKNIIGFHINTSSSTSGFEVYIKSVKVFRSQYSVLEDIDIPKPDQFLNVRGGYTGMYDNVGIGTDAPSSQLQIYSAGPNLRLTATDNTNASVIQFGDINDLDIGYLRYEHNGDYLRIGANNNERLRIQDSAEAVKVIGETALTGTTGGAKGLTLQTAGGTSCPLYFGSETHSAQKSMYLNGYWIYLRGHQNEGIRFIFSQPAGSAPRSDQYEFKYNAAYRPTGNTTWDGFSDRRAKENIQDVTSALDTIGRLRPVTFDWTNDYADRMNMFNFDKTDTRSYMWTSVKENGYDETRKNNNVGFIAQEFEEVFPNDITETEMQLGDETISDFKTVNFDSLIPMLTKAVQELKAENDSLRARLDAAGL